MKKFKIQDQDRNTPFELTHYWSWLNSDDYKRKSFNLYYGNGVVD